MRLTAVKYHMKQMKILVRNSAAFCEFKAGEQAITKAKSKNNLLYELKMGRGFPNTMLIKQAARNNIGTIYIDLACFTLNTISNNNAI